MWVSCCRTLFQLVHGVETPPSITLYKQCYLKPHLPIKLPSSSVVSMDMHIYLFNTCSMKILIYFWKMFPISSCLMHLFYFSWLFGWSRKKQDRNSSLTSILPSDVADLTAKCNILLAIPWRRADLATHKFAT